MSKAFASDGVPLRKRNKFTSMTSIGFTNRVGKYLGFPIMHGRVKRENFNFIIDRINHRLAGWKRNLLNKAGRLALASSTISSIPTYVMSTGWLPSSVCNQINSITRNFVWKDGQGKGINLVSWKKISRPKKFGGLGLRDARRMKTALLGKLVWQLIHENHRLWVQVMLAKYSNSNSLFYDVKDRGSFVWNSVVKAFKCLRSGFKIRIRNGDSSFFYADWSQISPLSDCVPFVQIHETYLRVRDVWDGNNWNLNTLMTILPEHAQNAISKIFIAINDDVEDNWVWHNNINGVYTVAEGYKWLIAREGPLLNSGWIWIWKLKIHEKVKFFLWLISHSSLPTNLLRWERGMANSNLCTRCNVHVEELSHALCDCPFAIRIWHAVFGPNMDYSMNLETWIANRVLHDPSLFLSTLWHVWLDRNKHCLQGILNNIPEVTQAIFRMSQECSTWLLSSSSNDSISKWVHWACPSEGVVALNVDGCSRGNPGVAGIGGVLRDHLGNWLCGFYGYVGYTDSIHAELVAMHQGLLLAWEEGFQIVQCQTDCLEVIRLISDEGTHFHRYRAIIRSINQLIARDWEVNLIHTFREGNMCADHLANVGANLLHRLVILREPLASLHTLILADAMGVMHLRL